MNYKKIHITLCLVPVYIFVFGQYPDNKKNISMYLNKENMSIKAEVLKKQSTFTADKDVNYYWYASNNIVETQGGYDGKLLHGAYSSFYLSNKLREKGKFRKGLKQGEWINWYENGKIQEVSNWKSGRKCSSYQLYNEYGDLMLKAHFKRGKLHGKMFSYDGKSLISEKKYRNGKEVVKKVKKKPEEQKIKKSKKEIMKNMISKIKKKKKNSPQPEKKKATDQKPITKTT